MFPDVRIGACEGLSCLIDASPTVGAIIDVKKTSEDEELEELEELESGEEGIRAGEAGGDGDGVRVEGVDGVEGVDRDKGVDKEISPLARRLRVTAASGITCGAGSSEAVSLDWSPKLETGRRLEKGKPSDAMADKWGTGNIETKANLSGNWQQALGTEKVPRQAERALYGSTPDICTQN